MKTGFSQRIVKFETGGPILAFVEFSKKPINMETDRTNRICLFRSVLKTILIMLLLTVVLILPGCGGGQRFPAGSGTTNQETELARQLETALTQTKVQDQRNEELLRIQAETKRDFQNEADELERINLELTESNRALQAKNEELQRICQETERQLEAQNVSFPRNASIAIIPNNGSKANSLKFENPKIFPPRRLGENIVVEISDESLFTRKISENNPAGDFQITSEGKQILLQAAQEIVRCYPQNIYRLEGHVDRLSSIFRSAGRDSYNDPSIQKAAIIAHFLVLEAGLDPNQIEICGSGAARPIVENNSESNRKRNARIEWIVRPESR